MTTMNQKHFVEDEDSFDLHLQRQPETSKRRENAIPPTFGSSTAASPSWEVRRTLKHHHHHHHHHAKAASVEDLGGLEREKEAEYWKEYQASVAAQEEQREQASEERETRIHELYQSSGIVKHTETTHGLMIDAGSTGSRLHIYEWDPRVLSNEEDIQDAVSGNKLSFPGTESRWTERLRPGLSTFALKPDEELIPALAAYLEPLLDFAKAVLHTKEDQWGHFPIYLRATAGMRILSSDQRARVMDAVRDLFAHNATFSPFQFVPEQARVLSGEEEAIYDWAGVNFLLGDLISQSEGTGSVVNPRKTHGALDLGGGSTQISFYESREDIMSNLFKLQIGQAKHWNVYAHSFLFYGINEAIHRFQARLVADKSPHERLVDGVYNPCMPGGTRTDIRSNIHLTNHSHMETWNFTQVPPTASKDGFYAATLRNDLAGGDPERCLELAKDLLHLEQNQWCEFAHQGDCSLAGVYQPQLPRSESFGEFVAFSNYHHVWKFLKLPDVASIAELEAATRHVCAMSHEEVRDWAKVKKFPDSEIDTYCFRSAYVFQLLHNGFGFRMNDTIRATNVINGHKVGWALGAMLYEINTLPWSYHQEEEAVALTAPVATTPDSRHMKDMALFAIFIGLVCSILGIFIARNRRNAKYASYEPIKETSLDV